MEELLAGVLMMAMSGLVNLILVEFDKVLYIERIGVKSLNMRLEGSWLGFLGEEGGD